MSRIHFWTRSCTAAVLAILMVRVTIGFAADAGLGGGHVVAFVAILLVDAGLASVGVVSLRGAAELSRAQSPPAFTPRPDAWDDDDD